MNRFRFCVVLLAVCLVCACSRFNRGFFDLDRDFDTEEDTGRGSVSAYRPAPAGTRYQASGFKYVDTPEYTGYCIESCDLVSDLGGGPASCGRPPVCIRVDVGITDCCFDCNKECPSEFVYLPDEQRVVPVGSDACIKTKSRKVYISKKRLCRLIGGCY